MANPGSEIKGNKKVCGRKKVNKYTRQDCENELARLNATKDTSVYGKDVMERLAELK